MTTSFKSNLKKIIRAKDDQIERAGRIIGGMAESYAKQLCPVVTGNLRNSISNTMTEEDGSRTVVIGTNVEYAPYVELGTGKRYELGSGRGVVGGRTAKPYLRPAIENHISEYQTVMEEELKDR